VSLGVSLYVILGGWPGGWLDPASARPYPEQRTKPPGLMSTINLKVNGQMHALDLDPSTPLLYALSDEVGVRGPKFGCGLGQCGACTVIMKGQAVRSCVTTVKAAEGNDIVTLEGLGTPEKPHPLQKAFLDENAAQCGFCLNGVILTAKALLDKNPKANESEIQQALSNVLCRCFTHTRMLAAIHTYAQNLQKTANGGAR
jgi:nicotinate dehydrogenase subunit A